MSITSEPPLDLAYERDIYSVSRLNTEVRAVLEGSFPLLWVEGEISNLSLPSSGHAYFSLKDTYAQVRCALFRPQRSRLRARPENGMGVLVRARVSLYEGRGEFQLLVEHLEPAGEGALRQAWERLKQRLAAEGLFDGARKRPLPAFPRQVGVISSPTGAALRDVLSVLGRRLPRLPVVLYPVQVQGEAAPAQIVRALAIANRRRECDALLLVRGGGSLEDLAAFNDEAVVRALAASELPVVCGVGHEIDVTLADLVADRRAATPSAAAELVSPDRRALRQRLAGLRERLLLSQARRLGVRAQVLANLGRRLARRHPARSVAERQQRLDELEARLRRGFERRLERARARLVGPRTRLWAHTPAHRVARWGWRLATCRWRLHQAMARLLTRRAERLARAAQTLDAVSPLATLSRGYAILSLPQGDIPRDAAALAPGQEVRARLARGRLWCRVERVELDP